MNYNRAALIFTISFGIICMLAIIAMLIYETGRQSMLRECPPEQHGAKLLYSEQRETGTVCSYASRWDGHGRTIKRKTL